MLTQQDAAQGVERLLQYGLRVGMLTGLDVPLARNALLDALRLPEPATAPRPDDPQELAAVLDPLLAYAVQQGIIENDTETERDLFDTRLMGCMMPRPSEISERFDEIEADQGVKAACDWFYQFNIDSGYIRADRVAHNIAWTQDSPYGAMQITINLSKPEKDPREVARLKTLPQVGYPKCMLCVDNVGYPGRLNHPARQTLRMLPLRLNDEPWYFQYSPYVYYQEHCIVLRQEHVPMHICRETFVRLLEFLQRFPHYFIGSNAGIPIVGGSILNHDHFQGGVWTMPMAEAPIDQPLQTAGVAGLTAGIVRWPMSVLRLRHADPAVLVDVADRVFTTWLGYDDHGLEIHAHTGDTPHNAITPIARMRDGQYELDLVLRNNRTSDEHPMGIFHVHGDLHHIKRENIGLIEVMGLFILPGRLQEEFDGLARILCGQDALDSAALADETHPLQKHLPWLTRMLAEGEAASYDEAMERIRTQCGQFCVRLLHDCGVFKDDSAGRSGFLRFLGSVGFTS